MAPPDGIESKLNAGAQPQASLFNCVKIVSGVKQLSDDHALRSFTVTKRIGQKQNYKQKTFLFRLPAARKVRAPP